MRRYLIGSLICLALIISVGANEVIIKPFPFLDVEYVTSEEWDNNPDNFYKFSHDLPPPSELSTKISSVLNHKSIEYKILWAVRFTRDLMETSKGDTIRQAGSVFEADEKYRSVCSESSKVFAALMNNLGVPSRVIWMHGHTVSEVYNGKKWILIDTYGNVRANDEVGAPLGIREVVSNYSNSVFQKIVDDDYYDPPNYVGRGYFNSKENVYIDQNLLLILKGDDLFDFHTKTRDLDSIIKSAINIDSSAVGEARQLVIDDYFVGNFGLRLIERYWE